MPGGNTRTGMFYTPFPLSIEKAAGATLTDVDGHTYTDFVGDFSAGLYGHSHPVIREALAAALDDGMAYGSSSPYEERLATLVCARFASIEQVRFTNSGTEANSMALVTARAVSGKDLVMVFEGAYHGGTIYFGRKSAPINLPFPFLIAPYNDAEEATRLIGENADAPRRRAGRADAGRVRRDSGRCGLSARAARGLQRSRRVADLRRGDDLPGRPQRPPGAARHRPRYDNARKVYRRRHLLRRLWRARRRSCRATIPSKPGAFVHHGTFNNNVLMLRAGAAGLERVFTPEVQVALNDSGIALRDALNGLAAKHGAPFQVTGLGSIMTIHFQSEPLRSIRDIQPRDERLRQLLHLYLIDKGFFTTRRGYMALSLLITEADCAGLTQAIDEFLAHHGHLLDAAPAGGSCRRLAGRRRRHHLVRENE